MATILHRVGLGRALTWAEYDANNDALNTSKVETSTLTALPSYSITSTQITNWDTAYGWGNHSSAGYLTHISQDTTPALGANLDVLNYTISSSTGIVNIADEIKASKFNIDTTIQTGSLAVGQLAWNDVDGCLEYQAKGGNVTIQIGQEHVIRFHNNTGSTLTDGQIVYINGSTGTLPTVALANANSEATSSNTLGMITEPVTNGSDGFLTINGIVNGLNTNAYTAGDSIWLSTNGQYTTTRPSAPNHAVFIGWVVKKSAGNGSILVNIKNGYELSELHDVNISSIANDQLLKYNSSTTVWENWTPNYLTSYTETDPIFVASAAHGITSTQITNWDTAYGWGNHASAGYLTSSSIGTTVQGYSSNLTSWSALAPSSKQDVLVSGTSIKTVNSTSLLGSGNISVQDVLVSGSTIKTVNSTSLLGSGDIAVQDVLVSGTTIKTINGTSVLGAGNISITSGQGLGSIIAYKANGSQDNIDITANTTLTNLNITSELLLGKNAVYSIETTATYGWNDNIAPFMIKGTGSNDPTFGTLWGGLQGYIFSATVMNQVFVDFHITHDYAVGTALYPHIHWTPTTTGTGVVRWGIEYSYAKGHGQAAFPATTTVYVEQTISTNSQWTHFIAEVSDANVIPGTNIEVDGVVKCRIFRDAAHANDTYAGTVHAWQADIHYQSNRMATKNKAPNFYI